MGKSVLFVCLGNICRSPIAEAVFLHLLKNRGLEDEWTVDSAAIGSWHVGGSPDPRASRVIKSYGLQYGHIVRQITQDDFQVYDFIFGMDMDNMMALERIAPKSYKGTVALLGAYDPAGEQIIRDPYYDDDDKGFHKCYEQCLRSLERFLEEQLTD